MGLLRKLGRAAVRRTGSVLTRHVLPDSLVPSSRTKNAFSTTRTVLGLLKPKKKKKKAKPSKPSPPKRKFDRNAWGQGRAIAPNPSFAYSEPRRPASSARPRPSGRSATMQKLHDLRKHPQLVLAMKMDELAHDIKGIKNKVRNRFSSSFRYH
jgi:hypothetical protein